jgi:hypothetical protein
MHRVTFDYHLSPEWKFAEAEACGDKIREFGTAEFRLRGADAPRFTVELEHWSQFGLAMKYADLKAELDALWDGDTRNLKVWDGDKEIDVGLE